MKRWDFPLQNSLPCIASQWIRVTNGKLSIILKNSDNVLFVSILFYRILIFYSGLAPLHQ